MIKQYSRQMNKTQSDIVEEALKMLNYFKKKQALKNAYLQANSQDCDDFPELAVSSFYEDFIQNEN